MENSIYIAERVFDSGTTTIVATYNKYKALFLTTRFILRNLRDLADGKYKIILREIILIPDLRIKINPESSDEDVESDVIINFIRANMLGKIQNTYEIMTSDDVVKIFIKED